ncbi:DsrE family protein [Burkholderia multivorans]|uniref:DsrE family protein n=1 Tax=Burkholderia multivorans TaxID=87883 RepID=UPI00201A1215|nr:DsrE family protein [Burkholderia multivorans]UQN69190.1 DsrE family protein [Burkholderia multivorans]UQN74918.1 DsrE family protein [Burkholderia multivorans]
MTNSNRELRIDVPVKLASVKAVFSVGSLAFEGDLPASIFHMKLILDDVENWNASAQIVAVFHTNAGHVTLNNDAYNKARNIETGNPYAGLIAQLIGRGVAVELCGATAKAHGWYNDDVLRDVKVNTDAMARTIQLVQEGFVKITEAA